MILGKHGLSCQAWANEQGSSLPPTPQPWQGQLTSCTVTDPNHRAATPAFPAWSWLWKELGFPGPLVCPSLLSLEAQGRVTQALFLEETVIEPSAKSPSVLLGSLGGGRSPKIRRGRQGGLCYPRRAWD